MHGTIGVCRDRACECTKKKHMVDDILCRHRVHAHYFQAFPWQVHPKAYILILANDFMLSRYKSIHADVCLAQAVAKERQQERKTQAEPGQVRAKTGRYCHAMYASDVIVRSHSSGHGGKRTAPGVRACHTGYDQSPGAHCAAFRAGRPQPRKDSCTGTAGGRSTRFRAVSETQLMQEDPAPMLIS